ncbi:MAG: MBL fold metallo-hydrolase [Burkholderiaceae bacterium]
MLPPSMRFIERDWLSSNQIVFLDDDLQASVVDTGYVKHNALSQLLVNQSRTGRSLTRILNTHLHSDHCGGNRLLTDSYDCEVLVPEASFEAASSWDESSLSFHATGQRCDPFTPTLALAPGQTIMLGGMPWQVHAAPGHDPESVILFQQDTGILISADALWGDGFGVIFPELAGHSGFSEQEAILKVIRSLRPRCVIPGHGPMFSDVEEAIKRAEARLAFLRSQPLKHAQYALKVLVKFLMLDRETANKTEFIEHLSRAQVPSHACAVLGIDVEKGITQTIEGMIASGQLFLSPDQQTLIAHPST